jgi:hypothetical protein
VADGSMPIQALKQFSEPYGSHFNALRWRCKTTSRGRRTLTLSHSPFLAALTKSDIVWTALACFWTGPGRVVNADSVRHVRTKPTHLGCTPRLASLGPARLLQCSRCVRRGRRDKSGGHGRRYGTVCDVQQACLTRRGMLQPPCTLRHHSARSHGMLDLRRQEARLRGCGGRPAHFPVPMKAVRAWLVPLTHCAAHSTRCAAAAPPYRAPPNMPRTAGDRQHSAPCNSHGEARAGGAWCICATHRHSHSSHGVREVWVRTQACNRA